MDGYTATRRIKADPALRSITIIPVTSYALDGEEKTAKAAGLMITCPNHLARANSWQKSVSIYPSGICCSAYGHNHCAE
jgi:CheY-like chemotaxis protein